MKALRQSSCIIFVLFLLPAVGSRAETKGTIPAAVPGLTLSTEVPMSNLCDETELPLLKSKKSDLQTLSDLEKLKGDPSRYWQARLLMNSKLKLLSFVRFRELFLKTSDQKIKRASLTCMVKLHNLMPSLDLPHSNEWKDLFFTNPETLFTLLLEELPTESKLSAGVRQPYSFLLLAISAHLRHQPREEIRWLKIYREKVGNDPYLSRFNDEVRLMLARADYLVGEHAESIELYRSIDKGSNAQVDVLNEMAWPLFMSNQIPQTIGLMQQLRVGALKSIFAPYPYLVSAMATLKYCLYPETHAILESFMQDYRASYQWLSKNAENADLYSEVLLALSGKSKVPNKITLEWIRSPTFLTRQADLNQIATEEALLNKMRATRSLTLLPSLQPNFVKEASQLRNEVLKRINNDLREKNRQLLASIIQVQSSIVELESNSLIQSNADKLTQNGARKKEPVRTKKDADNLWSWGRLPASQAQNAEIWDDEVGNTFQIKLVNRCKQKPKR